MDIEKILSRLVQFGTVTALDTKQRAARVKFQDTGITSGWLRVLQHHSAGIYIDPDGEHTHDITDTFTGGGSASTEPNHNHAGTCLTYWMPKVNDSVVVLYLPIPNSDGFVLGGI